MNRERAGLLAGSYSFPHQYDDCPCPRQKCERHGKCTECWQYHHGKGQLPYCLRKKKWRERFVEEFKVVQKTF